MSLSYRGVENLYFEQEKSCVARDCTDYAYSRESYEHTELQFTESNSVLLSHNFTPFEVQRVAVPTN